MVTFGGPADTAAPGRQQVAMALGTGGVLFAETHATGHGYFARWRTGLAEGLDAGVDLIGYQRGEYGGITVKPSVRRRTTEWMRLEAGLSAADDHQGKSVGAELAAAFGPPKKDGERWRYYGALRTAGALGLNGDWRRHPLEGQQERLRDAFFLLLNAGASGRLSSSSRFIVEGGYGRTFVEGQPGAGNTIYLAFGLLGEI